MRLIKKLPAGERFGGRRLGNLPCGKFVSINSNYGEAKANYKKYKSRCVLRSKVARVPVFTEHAFFIQSSFFN